jgi:hypothetical protein
VSAQRYRPSAAPSGSIPRRRHGNAEARIQIAIVEFVRWVAPYLVILHVPNGGWRSKAEAARFKTMGVLPGASDLILVLPEGRSAWWEVKAPGGELSDAQDEFNDNLDRLGHVRAVVMSIDDARIELARLGIETREAAPVSRRGDAAHAADEGSDVVHLQDTRAVMALAPEGRN